MVSISIILPVYNEQENINLMYTRMLKVLNNLKKSYEIIFVNDGSFDYTEKEVQKIRKKNKRVKLINFSRNFGHQAAVTAGLYFCEGNNVAVLDADLQDPPEILPRFFNKLYEGYDIVYAIRKKRKENIIKRAAYSIFYRILQRIANIYIPLDSGDFCVMNRKVVNTIKKMPERNQFIRGIRSWVGYKQTGLEYERSQRYAGKSNYSFIKLLKLALDGILSFSYIPLRFLTIGGFIAFSASILGSLMVIYMRFFTDIFVPGFATTVILIMFSGGLNMLAVGILGEYVARIYDEVKGRPSYIIESTHGFKKNSLLQFHLAS